MTINTHPLASAIQPFANPIQNPATDRMLIKFLQESLMWDLIESLGKV